MGFSFNIAIDGHASCGKSTIAKSISAKYGMRYIDTGAMYRAITLYCLRNNIINDKKVDCKKLKESIDEIEIRFIFDPILDSSKTFLNDKNVEGLIRQAEVSDNVSIVAQIQIVRNKLILLQRSIGNEGNVVMDGRDIGSKVFPDAKIKFFVTARPEVRAKRRYDEMIRNGCNISFNDVLVSINKRDAQDISRVINPLIKDDDAILLDTSDLTLLQQNKLIDDIIQSKLQE